jgi:hypothetical protein
LTVSRLLRRISPRSGISLGLIVIVLAIVAIGKLYGGSAHPLVVNGGASIDEGGAATGPPDDGEPSPLDPAPPSTRPGGRSALTVATEFANAWLHHTGITPAAWHAGVAKYATPALAAELDGADPAGVPADRVVGPFVEVDFDASYVQYQVPTDSGTLTLYLRAGKGHWLVSGVDWTAA